MEENYKVLWIDDDVNGPELMSERDALKEKNCQVTPITNPDDFDIDTISDCNCVIVDLSLPTGNKLTLQQTRGGSRTGLCILKELKKEHPEIKTVVYTVFDIPEVKIYCREQKIKYLNKSDLLADEFANHIVNLIKNKENE